jgi:NAD+ synthase
MFQEAGCQLAVLGLSGGIDSAVAAALCKQALGEAVLGVFMPCHSQPQDRVDARLVAEQLGIEMIEVSLDEAYDSLLRLLPAGTDLARANLKPRLRMLTLYFLANSRNGLVVGTGNKAELIVGYFTKYGDGGADILPLGDLSKRQVRELATHLGVPGDIVDKPPSAGLWPGQTDEQELGLSYAEIDAATAVLTGTKGVEVDPVVLDRVAGLRARSEHKRTMPPICRLPVED